MPPPYPDFDQLYEANAARLVVQLYAYVGDLAQAQDLVQEAFCRALARWPKVATYDDPVAWVRRVAWNLAVSHWRRTIRGRDFLKRQRPPRSVPGPAPDRVALMAALATLPEPQRRAVIMHYLGDLSIRAIAEQENTSENTIKQRLFRARAALAPRLADWLPGVGNA